MIRLGWLRRGILWIGLLFMAPGDLLALEVVASIKPFHSLTAMVMMGVDQPKLLVQSGASPHTYTLRPSEARMLTKAEVIIWGGPELESFLTRSLANLATKSSSLALMDLEGLTRLPTRKGGAWEEEEDDKGHDHDHDSMDPHIWLDPHNAKVMVMAIAKALSKADPTHQDQYQKNATTHIHRLEELDQQLRQELVSIKEKNYIVFHDAYHYFEHRYQLGTVGSIVVHPDRPPSVQRIQAIGQRIAATQAVCLFSEPQFSSRLAESVAASTKVALGKLDPIGMDLADGPEHYFQLLRGLARDLMACLKP